MYSIRERERKNDRRKGIWMITHAQIMARYLGDGGLAEKYEGQS